jgi:hypothetical protein
MDCESNMRSTHKITKETHLSQRYPARPEICIVQQLQYMDIGVARIYSVLTIDSCVSEFIPCDLASESLGKYINRGRKQG